MKLQKLIATLSLTTAIAATQVVYSPHLKIKEAWAQSPRPYVILVNGNADCCVWSSTSSLYMGELWNIPNAEFRMTAWDHFQHGGRQRKNIDIGVLGRYSTSNDADFIRDASDFINNQLAPNRPLVIIGHSYGGDSVIKLAHRVNRTIQFLGVIDPVGAGGFRTPIRDHGVPSNVDYFFNRWQENAFATDNIVPFDSRGSGSINGCRAGTCDQRPQNLARNADDSEIRVSCGPQEVTCEGWRLPGCNFGGCWSGSNGTKAKRLTHNPMPRDAYIQRQALEIVNQAIADFTPPSLLASVSSLDTRFRAVNDWAGRNGYAGAFPNFHQADHNDGRGVVFGVIALNSGVARAIDVPMSELGNPRTVEERFRAVNDWAGRNGYAGAFPNFHQADHNDGRGVVFGVIALNSGIARAIDVPSNSLR